MMTDQRDLIARLLEQHRAVESHTARVRGSLPDQEALASLEKARLDWTPGRFESLLEKRERLRQDLGTLDAGLSEHFQFEEKTLPPLVGEFLARAFRLQHRHIRREIAEARSTVSDAKLEGLDREDLLVEESRVQQRISLVLQLVEEHRANEELVLEMIETVLTEDE